MMQPIIDPVDKALLEAELTAARMIRTTNVLNNQIFCMNGNDCPHTMREIGRLRELSFRDGGGGTGKAVDADDFDYGRYAYQQLVVWNPADRQIVGGYRFALCDRNRDEAGEYHLSTSEIVRYSDKFKTEFLPYAIELGRSFVQPLYQPKLNNRSGVFSLDNLWDGLGALTVIYPEVKYFFGKITMYTTFNPIARDHILTFMYKFMPDPDGLVIIPEPLVIKTDCSEFMQQVEGLEFRQAYLELNRLVRSYGESIPPLFNAYINLSPTMRTFGTAVNKHFGGVEETGILITIPDIYPEKKERYMQGFVPQ